MINRIKEDMKQAMRDKDKNKLSTLRMLLTTIENKRIELKLQDATDLTEDQVIDCVNKNIKTVNQQIESLVKVAGTTYVQQYELSTLKEYLPPQLSDAEIRKEIEHALDLVKRGEIKTPMQYLSTKLKGKADMSQVSKIVKEYN